MSRIEVKNCMTKQPIQIDAKSSAKLAFELMVENDIRHLPVFHQAELVGIVSDRDLRSVVENGEGEDTSVAEIMSKRLYVVRENVPLKKVIREMFEQKYGSTVVIDARGWVRGIFTTIDALELLEKLLIEKETEESEVYHTIDDYFAIAGQRASLIPV